MEKKTFVINGRSGVGKDSLIEIVARQLKVLNASSVDPVKEIAKQAGWDGSKDERSRQLLIDIKKALVEYNDFPTKYLVSEYERFMKSDNDIMFAHIREPQEISKLMTQIPCKSILVTRESADKFNLANDDNVTKFNYDIKFANDKPLEQSGLDFIELLKNS